MTDSPLRLGVNIDHVATLRNARGGTLPDPITLANLAIEAGADGITAHLREDRRHVRDDDIARLKAEISKPLNFEMAGTDEMVNIALKTKPNACCLVPEKREELTTEGGLDVAGNAARLSDISKALKAEGILVSLFVDAEAAQLDAAKQVGADIVELHTGRYCDLHTAGEMDAHADEFARLRSGAAHAHSLGLEVHAGHGLNYATVGPVAGLPEMVELNIGHFLIGEALKVGLPEAVRHMIMLMEKARARPAVVPTERSQLAERHAK